MKRLAWTPFLALVLSAPASGAEAVAPPVMYAADLWQGRGEAVIQILNRTDSTVETLTIPAGGEAHYHSLHLRVTRCVDRPETLPRNAAVLLSTTDDSEPESAWTGWILAEEPSLSTFRSPLYGINVMGCAGPKTDPALAPLPKPVVPVLTASPPQGEQNQPGDLDDRPGGSDSATGPTRLAPLGDQPVPPASSAPPYGRPSGTASGGGPTQLTPFSGNGATPLPPPQAAPSR